MNKHVLQIGDDSRPLAEWSLSSAIHESGVGGVDKITLRMPKQIAEELSYDRFALTKLFAPGGACKFVGRAMKPDCTESAERGQATIEIIGPQFELERCPYTIEWAGFDADTLTPGTRDMARVVFNRTSSLRTELQRIIDAAREFPHVHMADSTVPALENIQLAEDHQKSLTCWTALKHLLQFAPQICARFDYETESARMRFTYVRWHDDQELIEFVPDGEFNAHHFSRTQLIGYQVRARDELLVRQFTIVFHIGATTGDVPRLTLQRHFATQSSIFENGAIGEVKISMKLRGPVFNGGTLITAPEAIPAGLASFMHGPYKQLWHSAQAQFAARSVNWLYRVGDKVTMDDDEKLGIIVRVVRDLHRGYTTVDVGPPGHMETITRPDMPSLERMRAEPPPEEPTYGFEPDAEENNPDDRSEDVCNDVCEYSGGEETPP